MNAVASLRRFTIIFNSCWSPPSFALRDSTGESSPEAYREDIGQLEQILSESIDATRSLTFELSPPVLYDRGLAEALEWLGDWMEAKHGLAVTVRAEVQADPGSEDVRVLLFQATRELLFNVVKHAQVSKAEVGLCHANGEVRVVVSDDGVGFEPGPKRVSHTLESGFGLFSIRERLDLVGGKMEVESKPGAGTRFTLIVPVKKARRVSSVSQPRPTRSAGAE